jgi:hypothetical protein
MRNRIGFCLLIGVAFLIAPAVSTVEAQSAAQTHVGHVMEAFPRAPEGQGLLSVALAEAAIVAEHARLAGSDRTDVGPMVRHARHVLHALDASTATSGPGKGMGVGPAADAIAQHIELAAQAEGASPGIRTHSAHVATAAKAVSARAAEMVEVANTILVTSDYVEAFNLVRQLQTMAEQLVAGADTSGDGEIALSEGGLQHVQQHMGLMTASASR